MIRGLGAEFNLAKALVDSFGSLPYDFGEELLGHEMGAGASGKETAVANQLQSLHVNLAVPLHGVLSGFF